MKWIHLISISIMFGSLLNETNLCPFQTEAMAHGAGEYMAYHISSSSVNSPSFDFTDVLILISIGPCEIVCLLIVAKVEWIAILNTYLKQT